jgi:uncharacterized protein (DUF58 family)
MRRVDAVWYRLGFAVVGLGVLVAVAAGGVPGATVLAGMATLVGVAAAGGGALLARRRVRADDPDDRDRTLVVPGDQLAARVAAGDDDGTVRDGLRGLAVAALRRSGDEAGGTDPAAAGDARVATDPRGRIRDGSWTDDDAAAAYLRDGPVGLVRRLRALAAGAAPEQSRAGRAADAVARRCGVDEPSSTPDDGSGSRDGDRPPARRPPAPDGDRRGRERSTGRWYGALTLAVAGTAVGALVGRPVVLLASVVCVGAAAYARLDRTPVPALDATRTVSDSTPGVGDRVTVAVTVENVGDATLPELRVRDGTPPGLPVAAGRTEVVTALAPGSTVTFEYVVESVRGRHAFEPPTAVVRGLAGATERRANVDVDRVVVTCVPSLPDRGRVPPVVARTLAGPGGSTAVGGGVEFAGVREYRRGDPASRVDWRRLARTGERVTVEYVEERLGEVCLLVDARRPAYCAAGRNGTGGRDDAVDGDVGPDADAARREPAVESCVSAAAAAAAALGSSGYRVGLAAASPRECRLAPGAGTGHRRRLERELATAPALARAPPDDDVDPATVAAGLADRPGGVEAVVLCSPLADEGAVELARHVRALGVAVTVLAPDPTRADDPWRRVARAARAARVRRLRAAGVTVVDRPLAEPGRDGDRSERARGGRR